MLTAWSVGKFDGDYVAKALSAMGALDSVPHKTVILTGSAAVSCGELEDGLR